MLYEAKLDSVLEEIMTRWGIPGLGVGIVHEDEIIYTRGLGVQSLDTRAPVQKDSIFCVASISKCFVASAVMQLVERGQIKLDAALVQYLPYFKLEDERYPQITIRQLLCHSSGLPDIEDDEYVEWVSHPETDEGAAERYVRSLGNLKLAAAPGERFQYSNIGYNILGDLIARVSGQPFETFVTGNILHPAGMPDSSFLPADLDQSRLVVPHLRTPGMIVSPVIPYQRADAPASFLHTTVVDMCHWGSTCLNQGLFNGQRILSPASYERMWTPAARRGFSPYWEDYSLGWNLGHYEGLKTVSHGGAGFGWTAFFLLLPEKKLSAIILSNEESFAHEAILQAVMCSLLDQEPQPGKVSWMVPMSQALQAGGLPLAASRYAELKQSGGEEYSFDANDLPGLVPQLQGENKIDLAIDMLKLNLQAFPDHAGPYTRLTGLYDQKGEHGLAEECLQKARSIKPV